MKTKPEFADLGHDHPLSTRATVMALHLAQLALKTEHHQCCRCKERATTPVKRNGGPIQGFCEICRQRALAATMRPRR